MFRSRQSKIERLDFIIAGTQKGGTSALHYHLEQHPNVTMAHSEEAHRIDHPRRHFFDDEDRFAGKVDYDILHEGIKLKRRSLITGSCTPIYTYWKPAMQRIRDYHPGIKLIILLRNPIDRAFSHWNMYRERNQESFGLPAGSLTSLLEVSRRKKTSSAFEDATPSYAPLFEGLAETARMIAARKTQIPGIAQRGAAGCAIDELFRIARKWCGLGRRLSR